MAAGRTNVSKRREDYYDGYSKKEVVHYRNGTRDAKVIRDWVDDKYKHGYRYLSNGLNSGPKRVEARFDDAHRCKNGEVSKCDDGILLPSAKKRKFSPIVWDLDEKKVEISSKKRIAPMRTALRSLKSSVRLVSEVPNVVSDGGVAKSPALENKVKGLDFFSEKSFSDGGSVVATESESPGELSPSLPQDIVVDDQVQSEVEEFVQMQNTSTSRWASDSDLEDISLSDGEDAPGKGEQLSKRSTPESGEFCRENSEDGARLSESDIVDGECSSKDEYSENELEVDDVLDVDNTAEEDIAVEEPAISGQRSSNMLQSCRHVLEYEYLNKVNEGTYGVVYRARDKKTGEIVALKKVKMNVGRKEDYLEYGFPTSSLREINILLSFKHPSVVRVKEVVMDDFDSVFMVMEYMEHDLKGLMESMKFRFSTSDVKCLMLQLLEGVKYLHDNWVLHRDLKTSNLLLNNRGELKICDFGMSRQYGSPLKPYTSMVVTLWYRAPELLLGAKKYSTAVDMWSVGCIMAEMLAKKPLFSGTSEADQIDKIFKTLGTPTEKDWPGLSELPGRAKAKFVNQPYNLLRRRFPATSFIGSPVLSESGFDLLNRLLTYDPDQRITVDDALNHDWFREDPLPKFNHTFSPQHTWNRHLEGMQKKRRESGLGKCSDSQHDYLHHVPFMKRLY
ncbi:hypothetical protein Patl1_18255 [Pistacia atlantica]|uniref:Uncharacterized protein n=1 Tax=Pistacia atlantica TaxID=434234 RepID=A0ACC1BZ78_9ROSI|nr:hypothetical protein Patl1_18255 [Pistacia atlantica]